MSARARGCFVTGTDTGVGKTVVSCELVRRLRSRGLRVGVMKPIETGAGRDGPLDAQALRAAARSDDSLTLVCPQHFALPAAPSVAAAAEHREVDLVAVDRAFAEISAGSDFMVVEGAGGLLVPVSEGVRMADLSARLGLPVLIVARSALGTINHTLLTVEAAVRRGLLVIGVVVSHADGELSAADRQNLGALRQALGDRWIGEIPALGEGERAPADALDVDRVLRFADQSG